MLGENTGKIIIPTLAHQMLKSAVDVVAKTAGLGIVTGAPGIGKTFALNAIADDLRGQGVQVVLVTVSPEIEGSIRSFCQAVTGSNEGSKYGAADALEASLRG